MLIEILVDLILLGIIVLGGYYGYKKGFFSIALKPFKTIVRIVVAYWLCKSVGEFVFPIFNRLLSGKIPDFLLIFVARIFSTIFAFISIYILFGFLLSVLSYVINNFFTKGFIGRINSVMGLLLAGLISLVVARILATLSDHILSIDEVRKYEVIGDFNGGPIYEILKRK